MKTILCFAALLALVGAAEAAACGGSAEQALALPQSPFAAIAGSEPCTLFVSLSNGNTGRIAAFRREKDKLIELGSVAIAGYGGIMALSHDNSLLIAPDGDGVVFVDPKRLLAGDNNAVLGRFSDGGKDAVSIAIAPDDRTAFAADEHSATIAVIDLVKARANGFGREAQTGSIRVGNGPVGLAVAPDGKTLFATVQILPLKDSPLSCKAEHDRAPAHREGAVLAIDVERARSDVGKAVIGGALAGCNPVRLALSPKGDRAYVTARDSDALVVLDTRKITTSTSDAVLARIALGPSPVGVAVAKDGTRVYVGNSNRFVADKNAPQTVSVVDTATNTVIGQYRVGAFPREITITPDGTLLVANANSKSLTLIDLTPPPVP